MERGVSHLYRAAIEKMAKSADHEVEKLRRAIARGERPSPLPDPEALARITNNSKDWGEYAFADLRGAGFVRNELLQFDWVQIDPSRVGDELATVAGIEARSIIRLSLMNCANAMPEIERRLQSFVQAAAGGKPLASLLAHQKLMFAVVAATGEVNLLEEYAKRACVALVYIRSLSLEREDLEGMSASAQAMVSKLCDGNARDCAADATSMRLHPRRPALV